MLYVLHGSAYAFIEWPYDDCSYISSQAATKEGMLTSLRDAVTWHEVMPQVLWLLHYKVRCMKLHIAHWDKPGIPLVWALIQHRAVIQYVNINEIWKVVPKLINKITTQKYYAKNCPWLLQVPSPKKLSTTPGVL